MLLPWIQSQLSHIPQPPPRSHSNISSSYPAYNVIPCCLSTLTKNLVAEPGQVNKKKIIYSFKSRAEDGMKVIDDFINGAWKYYMDELDKHTGGLRPATDGTGKTGGVEGCKAPCLLPSPPPFFSAEGGGGGVV